MINIYSVLLIPHKEISASNFMDYACTYYEEETTFINRYFNMSNPNFSYERALLIKVKKEGKRYFEVSTNREIYLEKEKSENEGYIALNSSLKPKQMEKINFSENETVIRFLNNSKEKRMNLTTSLLAYIDKVLKSKKQIDDYVANTLRSNPYVSFKWVYISNNEKFERIVLPLLDNAEKANEHKDAYVYYIKNGIIPFESRYVDIIFNLKINSIFEDDFYLNERYNAQNNIIYAGEDVNININNFEALASIYELINNPNMIKEKIDAVIAKSKVYKK